MGSNLGCFISPMSIQQLKAQFLLPFSPVKKEYVSSEFQYEMEMPLIAILIFIYPEPEERGNSNAFCAVTKWKHV